MEPWEVMISESQERMVAIVSPDRLAEVEAVIDRWELHRGVIGEVTASGELRAFWDGEVVGAIPARHLTDNCPRYVVEQTARAATPEVPFSLPPTRETLLRLLASPPKSPLIIPISGRKRSAVCSFTLLDGRQPCSMGLIRIAATPRRETTASGSSRHCVPMGTASPTSTEPTLAPSTPPP